MDNNYRTHKVTQEELQEYCDNNPYFHLLAFGLCETSLMRYPVQVKCFFRQFYPPDAEYYIAKNIGL